MPSRRTVLFLSVVVPPASGWVVLACSGAARGPDGGPDGAPDGTIVDASPPLDARRDADARERRDVAPDRTRDVGRDVGRDTEDADAGPPTLVALAVTAAPSADASAPVTLVPAFSPEVNDYYVRCASGTNSFEVSMTASPGATSRLTQPTVSPFSPSQTVAAAVVEGAAMVAVAQRGSVVVEYWVRCLPHDFPELEPVLYPEAGAPTRGYYLLGNQSIVSGTSGYAMVLDVRGVPVWFQRNPGGGIYVDVDDVVPGAISYLLSPETPGEIGIHTLSPPSTSYIAPDASTYISRHELRFLSSGHYLVILPPTTLGVDMTGASVPLPDGGSLPLGPNTAIQDCEIVEFDSTGRVYWTWLGSSHIDPAKETVAPLLGGTGPDGGALVDPIHCNSIDLDPNDENRMLVSAKCADAVWYVDRRSGLVLWKMGGTMYSKDHGVLVPVDDPFHAQHDARFQPGWSSCPGGGGSISLFDDESTTTQPARGVVYDVTVGAFDASASGDASDASDASDAGDAGDAGAPECGGFDAAAAPGAHLSWQYAGLWNSVEMGSFRILPDGSRVVGWGVGNVPGLVFSEIDGDKDVFDFFFPQGFGSYRVIKVPAGTFDLEILRTTTALP